MKNIQASTAERPNDILDELHALVTKAEKLIASSTKSDSADVETLKERIEASRGQISELYSGAKNQLIAGAKCTHNAIQTKPYQALVVATGVGILIGVLARRGKCCTE